MITRPAATWTQAFFPIANTGPALAQISRAKRVCERCPVRVVCLEWALATGQDAGVWEGATEEERRVLRPRRARAAP